MANFMSFANAKELMAAIGVKFDAIEGAFTFRGTCTFANLPSVLTQSMVGYVYNLSEAFETDNRFIEGAGKEYPVGTNVGIADVGTITYNAVVDPAADANPLANGWYELNASNVYVLSTDEELVAGKTYYTKTENHIYKFDVAAGFIDVEGIESDIQDVANMIADEFDEDNAYSIGDYVNYDGKLYRFINAHTATDPWDATEAIVISVATIVTDLDDRTKKIRDSLIEEFDITKAYAIGDSVGYQYKIYKFTAAHAANAAWDPAKVTEVTIKDLIDEAEPESFTAAQINALIALLD